MHELIFTLNIHDKDSLGNVRCIEGLEAAINENCIWLRGLYDTAGIDKHIKQLPTQHSYYIGENNLLFSPGSLTPVAVLPALEWLPVAEFITIEIPVAALPGQLHQPAMISIIPSTISKKGDALLTTLQQWKAYATSAPAIRLAQLQFAVSQKNEVLILGDPLPSIPGKEYWMTDNILLPNGYDFEIPMAASFISKKLNAQKDAVLLFDVTGAYEKIGLDFFVPAKRSAVRLTGAATEQ
jgi:MoxR-vWA-beta-propeller ternary system domain bpX2